MNNDVRKTTDRGEEEERVCLKGWLVIQNRRKLSMELATYAPVTINAKRFRPIQVLEHVHMLPARRGLFQGGL